MREDQQELSSFDIYSVSNYDKQHREGFEQLARTIDIFGGIYYYQLKIYKLTFIRWRMQRTCVAFPWTSTRGSAHQDGDRT